MKVVIFGGAGVLGKMVVRDLVMTSGPETEIVVADQDFTKAVDVAASFGVPNVKAVWTDVRDHNSLTSALGGAFCVVNAAQYRLNLDIMNAAADSKSHYIDLGGLYHTTRQQLELDDKFRSQNVTAIVGLGGSPGVTNMLAAWASEKMEKVNEIHFRTAELDQTKYEVEPLISLRYSLKTVLEEFNFDAPVLSKGQIKFIKPLSGSAEYKFANPVGKTKTFSVIHSELATVPLAFAEKGIREVTFKASYDPKFWDRIRFLIETGLASEKDIELDNMRVVPLDVVNKIILTQPPGRASGPLKQTEIVQAVVKGMSKRKKATVVAECICKGNPKWKAGSNILFGSPASIGVQMLADGSISAKGVVAPETAVPVEPFFKQLKKRGFKVSISRKSGWGYKV